MASQRLYGKHKMGRAMARGMDVAMGLKIRGLRELGVCVCVGR
jgi:hypothetical protein